MTLTDAARMMLSMEHQVDGLRGFVGIDQALTCLPQFVWPDNQFNWHKMNEYQVAGLIFSTFAFFHDTSEKVLIAGPIGREPKWFYDSEKGEWRNLP